MKNLILSVCAGLFLTACGEPKKIESLKDLSPDITSVQLGADTTTVEILVKNALTETRYLEGPAYDMKSWAETIPKDLPAFDTQKLVYHVSGETTDKYGNTSNAPLYSLTFDYAEIKKIKDLSGTTIETFLNNFVVSVDGTPLGKSVIAKWCLDDRMTKAAQFCKKAVHK